MQFNLCLNFTSAAVKSQEIFLEERKEYVSR